MTNTPTVATPPNNLSTAALAAELATRLYPVADTLRRYSITKAQLQHLMQDPQFRHQITEYRREWESPLSARERVRMKSALAVEDGLVELYRLYHDVSAHPQARLDAFKQLVNLADMQPKQNAQTEGSKFTLNITLAGQEKEEKLIIDGSTVEDV